MDRAYSLLTIKAVDDEQRVIEGIATTPTPDRVDDIVEPMGAKFALPIPLLWQHKHDQPVGMVEFAQPTPEGIPFKARLPEIREAGRLKDRVDEAWQSVKAKLIRGVSIGFKTLAEEPRKGSRGYRIKEWNWLELSLVTIPANIEATIQTVKSYDVEDPAATGTVAPVSPPPGDSGRPVRRVRAERKTMPTIVEQIKQFEATRAAKSARMDELMAKAAEEGCTLDDKQSEEYDTLQDEVEAVDKHLVRLRKQEVQNKAAAVPVAAPTTKAASDTRGGLRVVSGGGSNLPKGAAFTRYAMSIAAGHGSIADAMRDAELRWKDSSPEVIAFMQARHYGRKAEPGTTTDDVYGWAAPLVYPQNLVSEFVDLLRPATILGKLTGIRNVPFNVRVPVQTGGSTVNWVGEAAPKPVSDLSFDAISLAHHKVAGIVVLTDELVKLSTPSAEDAVRRDLVEQTVRFIDASFINASLAGTANNPASITYNVSPAGASGEDADSLYSDINDALATFDDTDLGTGSLYILMRPSLARGISALRNQLGQFEFTGLTPAGGTLMGFPVITSNSVGSGLVILVKADEVLLADDGNVVLDSSREATLDMNGGESPNFNLWQRNCIGIRAERGITWTKRRPDAVAVINNADYGPVAAS